MVNGERQVREERVAREAWQRLMWLVDRGIKPAEHSFAPLHELRPMVVDAVAEATLVQAVAAAWERGWQPGEVVHEVRHRADRRGGRLVDLAIAVDHDLRRGVTVDPRWRAQIDQLEMREISTCRGWLKHWRDREKVDHLRGHRTLLAVWAALFRLPDLETLIPPPGRNASAVAYGVAVASAESDPLLERIRKLLAKAEATGFEAEAAAFTAKAQELMTRHAIGRARLEQGAPAGGATMVRLCVDPPYVVPKQVLLGAVARANRCRAVAYRDVDLSMLVGHADDLAAVQVLFTSLLVQATNAMTEATASSSAGARSRTTTYRHTFLLAYAHRISERLRNAEAEVLAEPGTRDLVPVLRARAHETDALVEEVFGSGLTSMDTGQRFDPAGAVHGRAAADRARLHAGELSA